MRIVWARREHMFTVVGMDDYWQGEDNSADTSRWNPGYAVKYLTDEERAGCALSVKDGLIYDASGKLFDTSDANTIQSGESRAIFVMMADGSIYSSKTHLPRMFHHSSLAAGGPVASAGEMIVIRGRLQVISNDSGHYRPSPTLNRQVVKELEARGVDFAEVRIEEIRC